jgi:hypothetical protein
MRARVLGEDCLGVSHATVAPGQWHRALAARTVRHIYLAINDEWRECSAHYEVYEPRLDLPLAIGAPGNDADLRGLTGFIDDVVIGTVDARGYGLTSDQNWSELFRNVSGPFWEPPNNTSTTTTATTTTALSTTSNEPATTINSPPTTTAIASTTTTTKSTQSFMSTTKTTTPTTTTTTTTTTINISNTLSSTDSTTIRMTTTPTTATDDESLNVVDSSPTGGSQLWWLGIVIPLIVLALVGIVVVMLFKNKRRQSSNDNDNTTAVDNASQSNPTPESNYGSFSDIAPPTAAYGGFYSIIPIVFINCINHFHFCILESSFSALA